MKTAYTMGLLRIYAPLKQNSLFTQKMCLGRPLINSQECPITSDPAHFDTDCIPTTVNKLNPYVSKVHDRPLNDKALKTFITLASKHYSYRELFFLTAQSGAFYPQNNIDILWIQFLNLLLMLKLPLLQNLWKIFRNWTCQCSINWIWEKFLYHQKKWRIDWTIPSYYFWIVWHWTSVECFAWISRGIFLQCLFAIESENHATLF